MIFVFLGLIVFVHVFVLSKLVFMPYPELFIYPYLINHGLVPYRDILDQHFPGLMFFPLNFDSLGMHTPEVARLWQYGVVVATHIILYLVAKKFFGPKKAILANIFYALWQPFFEGWVLWIDSFLPILTLLSLYLLKSKKVFWAGLLLGLALLFKQVIAPLILLVGLYILLKEKKIKPALLFGLGVFIPFSFLVFYILNLGIWNDFIFWTITFNMTTFAQMGRKYGTLTEIVRVFGVYGFTIFAFFDKKAREEALLVFIFLIGSLASVYARFDFVHLQPSLPYVALTSVFAIGWLLKHKFLKILVLFYALASVFLLFQFYIDHAGNKVFFFGGTEKKLVQEIRMLSKPEDKIFGLGTLPHIYQMVDRLPPGGIFVFQFPWFMIEAEERVFLGLVNDPPKVVLRDKEAEVGDQKLIFFMPKIEEYVEGNYKTIDKIDGIEIMIAK